MKDYAKMILSLPVCSKTGRYLKKKNPSDTECVRISSKTDLAVGFTTFLCKIYVKSC